MLYNKNRMQKRRMKGCKVKNKIIKIFLIFMLIIMIFNINPVYADDWHEEQMREQELNAKDPSKNPDFWEPTGNNTSSLKFQLKIGKLLGYINVIGVVVSVIVVGIVGIKYMIGSVEEKAEYKKTVLGYLIGAGLLFSATTLPNILYKIGISI